MMRVAIVTGAAQGIGRRTAEVLAERGYTLVLSDLRPSLDSFPSKNAIEHLGDITDEKIAAGLADTAKSHFGRIDVLVNNAGISLISPMTETSAAQIRRVIDVNLIAPFLTTKAVGQVMLEQRTGSIINVASIAGISGVAHRAAYNASKHGLVGMTRTLAAEWGGFGVRSNAVCPGWVKTPMDDDAQALGTYVDSDITDRVPMGRFASPDDIAKAIAFLADPEQSAFINGQTIVVDGGWTADASWQSLRLSCRPKV
jgi:NAD(P)-dependent dehydrogenase (short-subunit alcohol dehydrogenase family)